MDNRYLCKGKDKDDGRWYQGYYLLLHDTTYCIMPSDNVEESKRFEKENTHHYIVFEQMTDWVLPNKHLRAEILPETLCRCTGLKDKNGKLIWENDIVSFTHSKITSESLAKHLGFPDFEKEEYTRNYVIEFVNTYCTYGLRFRNKSIHFPCKASTLYMHDCIVIGNIFDNPELVEVGE